MEENSFCRLQLLPQGTPLFTSLWSVKSALWKQIHVESIPSFLLTLQCKKVQWRSVLGKVLLSSGWDRLLRKLCNAKSRFRSMSFFVSLLIRSRTPGNVASIHFSVWVCDQKEKGSCGPGHRGVPMPGKDSKNQSAWSGTLIVNLNIPHFCQAPMLVCPSSCPWTPPSPNMISRQLTQFWATQILFTPNFFHFWHVWIFHAILSPFQILVNFLCHPKNCMHISLQASHPVVGEARCDTMLPSILVFHFEQKHSHLCSIYLQLFLLQFGTNVLKDISKFDVSQKGKKSTWHVMQFWSRSVNLLPHPY